MILTKGARRAVVVGLYPNVRLLTTSKSLIVGTEESLRAKGWIAGD